jgi:hypothetical protein
MSKKNFLLNDKSICLKVLGRLHLLFFYITLKGSFEKLTSFESNPNSAFLHLHSSPKKNIDANKKP